MGLGFAAIGKSALPSGLLALETRRSYPTVQNAQPRVSIAIK